MVDWSGIGRAVLDVNRREQGLPTQDEQLLKQAMDELKRRQAFATAGLTEAQAAALPQQQDLQRRVQEATITAREAQARSADALASSRANEQPEGTIKQSSDGTFYRIVDDKAYPVTMAEAQAAGENPAASQGGSPLVGRVPGAGGGAAGSSLKRPFSAMYKGEMRYIDPDTRKPVEGLIPPPTAEARNMEIQGAAVDPAFETMLGALDSLEQAMGGDNVDVIDRLKGLVPGNDVYYAKDNFIKSARALAGAIVARQAGEGSRLSDEDRKAYSEAAAIVNNVILLPGGIEESRKRLLRVRRLLADIQARRRQVSLGQKPMSDYGTDPNDVGADVDVNAGSFPEGQGADPLEGRTATGPNGEKVIRRGGQWVPLQ